MSKKTRNTIIAVAVLLVLVIGALALFIQNRPAAQQGDKTITVTVVHGDASEKSYSIHTSSENLRGALEEQSLVEGTESQYGLFVHTVDGETVDDGAQQWWCFTKGGEALMTGVDGTMIADGDQYEITFTTGW